MVEITDCLRTACCPARHNLPCDLGPSKRYPDRSGKIGEVSVRRCQYCGIGISIPALDDVASLYESRESQDFQPLTSGLARRIKSLAFHREARRLLKQVGRKPCRVLDFGCGSGLFTRCLGNLLPRASVIGTDFHDCPPVELAGRSYLSNDELWSERGAFDLILAMHVIEHDDDPMSLLAKLRTLGSAGCTFVFEVPNVDCMWAPIFGESWDAWYLPFHRTHFSRSSLRSILERAGFEIVREIDASIPSMGRSIANVLKKQNTLPFLLVGAALHPIQLAGERLSGKPSTLRVIARAKIRL